MYYIVKKITNEKIEIKHTLCEYLGDDFGLKIKERYNCALVLTNDLLGGKWKLRVLWHIIYGDNRFSLLERAIPDITQKVLSSQLNELESSKIITKEIIDDKPPKIIIYKINEECKGIIPLIESICGFTKEYAKTNCVYVKD